MQQQRYFDNPWGEVAPAFTEESRREILVAAGHALKRVKAAAKQHTDVSGGGAYVGLGGVALTYLRLAERAARGVKFSESKYLAKHTFERALALADAFASDAAALLPERRRVTFLEGYSGALALASVVARLRGDERLSRRKAGELEAYWSAVVDRLPPGECEVLYGRAGYLYALLFAERRLAAGGAAGAGGSSGGTGGGGGGGGGSGSAAARAAVDHLLREGVAGAAAVAETHGAAAAGGDGGWGLMYEWHGKNYLGFIHGLSGVAHLLLHRVDDVRARAGGPEALARACGALAGALLPSGNLPSSLGGGGRDRLVQLCHGAPGLIPTMLKAEEVLCGGGGLSGGSLSGGSDGDGRYLAAARRAARAVWRRGLLRKGVGLCHGVAGNGYALLAMWRATREEQYLEQARAFALFAARRWEELYDVPDRAASLFEGAAGFVCFALDAVDPENAWWPGVDV